MLIPMIFLVAVAEACSEAVVEACVERVPQEAGSLILEAAKMSVVGFSVAPMLLHNRISGFTCCSRGSGNLTRFNTRSIP